MAIVLSHVARFEPRLQRLAFTTEINSRDALQREMQALSHLKRNSAVLGNTDDRTDYKRYKPTPSNTLRCFHCGKLGHKSVDCRLRKDTKGQHNTSSETSARRFQRPPDSLVCFKCGATGHFAAKCPNGPLPSSSPVVAPTSNNAGGPAGAKQYRVDLCSHEQPQGELISHGERFSYFLDAGAECSLIKESVARKLPGKRVHNVVTLTGIGQSSVDSILQILFEVTINDFSIEVLFHVLPDQYLKYTIMIGREVLHYGFEAKVTSNTVVLSRVKQVLACSVDDNVQTPVTFESIDTDIPDEYRPQLTQLLEKFRDSFSYGVSSSRVTTGQLHIRLIDPSRTVQRRPYRLSEGEKAIMRDKVSELLRAGVIQPSCSPFSSPALLVKKKDGSDRMCVDYRQLNDNTVADRYPLPLINDLISRLGGAQWFVSLDACSGYHLIPVHPDSIEMTSFVTPEGQWEYLAMPFGLKNATSVFQRAVNNALGDFAHTFVVSYVDDLLLTANSVDQSLERLQLVLERLTKAGSLSISKSVLFSKTKLNFWVT